MNRRTALGVIGAATFSAATFDFETALATGLPPTQGVTFEGPMQFGGRDLAGWSTVLGDGIFAPSGEPPVSLADITTADHGEHSALLANVNQRPIMAHTIAFHRLIDKTLFDYRHDCSYAFRMPHLHTRTHDGVEAQTVEGGLFIWDGGRSRRDYGLAFQWVLNPWDPKFGQIQTWSMNGAGWKTVGSLEPDNAWHQFEAVLEHRTQKACILIDGEEIPTAFTSNRKPEHWGTETAARLQVEAISLDPGNRPSAPTHTVHVRDWTWTCTPV